MEQDILALKYAETVGNIFKAASIRMNDITACNMEMFARMTNVDLG